MNTHIMTFRGSSIVLGGALFDTNLVEESCQTNNVVIIADDHLAKIYGEKLKTYLQKSSKQVLLLTFPAGESSKSRSEKERLEDEMQKAGYSRDTTLIALGGGVATDLAGFIASTYCRGIPFVSMPTSLLAMVDASVGGKTGVNTPYGKNLIGTFYLPHALLIDFDFLKTLKPERIKEGLVEVIKKALIYDEKLFEMIEENFDQLIAPSKQLEEVIKRAVEIKLEVIEEDFEETSGKRRILNFGHTVGHALEKQFKYQMSHGVAVAYGMIAESFMAVEQGLLKNTEFNRIVKLLKPFIEQKSFDIAAVYEHMALDKKSQDQLPRFVLIDRIGHVLAFNKEYCTHVEKDIVLSALKFIQEL